MRLATEWGFETLRRWCAGNAPEIEKRRSMLKFVAFFIKRRCGFSAKKGAAVSWLGSGQKTNVKPNIQTVLRRAV